MKDTSVSTLLRQMPVMVMLPLLVKKEEELKQFLLRLQAAGYRAVELLDRDWSTGLPERIALYSRLADFAARECRDIRLGLGSMTTIKQAQAFAALKPAFAVLPGTEEQIICEFASNNVEYCPGVATPTELMKLLNSRYATPTVKIYPARDPKNVAEILIGGGGHTFLPICTGRVNTRTMETFTGKGWAVGIGSEWNYALDAGAYDEAFGGREYSVAEQLECARKIADASPLRN